MTPLERALREAIALAWVEGRDGAVERCALADAIEDGLTALPPGHRRARDLRRQGGWTVHDMSLWWDAYRPVRVMRLATPAPVRYWYRDQMKAG